MRRFCAVFCCVLVFSSVSAATSIGGSVVAAEPDPEGPVEVVSARTETSTLYENPDGTFKQRIASEPVRVKTDTGWHGVDYTLERRPDGSVRPKMSPSDVALSGGGDQPLTEQDLETATLVTRWPTELPRPVLDGSTATYPDVLPGVDLTMTTDAGGVRQVLVVKSAKAAANPDLRRLDVTTETEGDGKLLAKDGGLSVVDRMGQEVASAPEPVMWDSSGIAVSRSRQPLADGSEAAVEQRVDGPAQGDDIDPVGLSLKDDVLTLTPTSEALTSADVSYPVYIDPNLSGRQTRWAMAFKEHASSSFYKWTGDNGQGVGYQNYDGVSTKRLFWYFPISGLKGAEILEATLDTHMTWSASCTPTTTDLYRVTGFDSSLSWNNMPSTVAYQSSVTDAAGYEGCYPSGRREEYKIGQAAKAAAASGSTYLAFVLKAKSETDPRGWKRMMNNTWMTIIYNRPPEAPRDIRIDSGIKCGGTLGTISSPIRFSAVTDEPDDHDTTTIFHYWRLGSNDPDVTMAETAPVDNGARTTSPAATAMIGSDKKAKAGNYRLRVRSFDHLNLGSETSQCDFTFDPTAPPTPQVQPLGNHEDIWRPGTSQSFRFVPQGDLKDVESYVYSVNSNATKGSIRAYSTTKTAVVEVTGKTVGLQVIRVRAVDAAGNESAAQQVTYETNEPIAGTVSRYSFDKVGSPAERITDEGTNVTGGPKDLFASSMGVFALRGKYADENGRSLDDRMLAFLPNTTESVAGPKTLNADRSFTVSAWLDPTFPEVTEDADGAPSKIRPMTAVSYGKSRTRPLVTLGIDEDRQYEAKVFIPDLNSYLVAKSTLTDDGQPGQPRFVVVTYRRSDGRLTLAVSPDAGSGEAALRSKNSALIATKSPALSTDMLTSSLRLGSTDEPSPIRYAGYVDHLLVSEGWADTPGQNTLWAQARNRAFTCEYFDNSPRTEEVCR